MSTPRAFFVASLALLLMQPGRVVAQPTRFTFAAPPVLLDCGGGACFRLLLNAVDERGNPVSVPNTGFRVFTNDGASQQVFYFAGDAGPVKGFYWVMLVDTSGSMNTAVARGETRFEAVKAALQGELGALDLSQGHVAIAPFDSHQVASRIRAARFYTRTGDLKAQIASLARPSVGNTALYTAVHEALAKLRPFREEGYEAAVVVFTDGRNDVRPGDDRDLLGDDGLAMVQREATDARIGVSTIGFGPPGSFDANTLRQMAAPTPDNFATASTRADLARILRRISGRATTRVQLTVGPVAKRRADLAGRSISFRVVQEETPNRVATEGDVHWVSPALGAPVAEGVMTDGEARGWLTVVGTPEASDNLMRLVVLVGYGALLALLWFVVPRWIWPQGQMAAAPAPRPQPQPPPQEPASQSWQGREPQSGIRWNTRKTSAQDPPSSGGGDSGMHPRVTIPSRRPRGGDRRDI